MSTRTPVVDPAGLPFTTRIAVRFRDTDAMGHVNNAVYFTYLEVARTAYWFELVGKRTLDEINFIVLKAECLFRSPAVLGEVMVVKSGITRLGNTSFTWEYHISDEAGGREVAAASTELVMYDYAHQRPTRIPADFRERIERFQAERRVATLE